MGYDQPGVDSGVHPKRFSNAPLYFGTQMSNHFMQFQGGFDSPERVVFMGRGDAKQGQDLVPDELIDAPSKTFHDAHCLGLDPAHEPFYFFGIELFIHRCVPGKVGKDDGGLAAFPFGYNRGLGYVERQIRLL